MTSYPTISIVIPTYNESHYIDSCLKSIFSQNYPKKSLDIIIVDNYSTDDTIAKAGKYPVRVFKDSTKDAQYLKMIGFKRARGEYFIFLDADNRLVGSDWFIRMLVPHRDKRIAGSVTDIIPDPHDPPLSRYFAGYSFYSSPLFSFFSTHIKKTFVERKCGYILCKYTDKRIPPTGSCLYRMSYLIKAGIGKHRKFMELDVVATLVLKGYRFFAYVPETGMYHTHICSIREIPGKRKRNIDRNYLKDVDTRQFTWIDYKNPKDIGKIGLWMIVSFTGVIPFLKGIVRAIRKKDLNIVFYEPVVTFIETASVVRAILVSQYRSLFFRKLFRRR